MLRTPSHSVAAAARPQALNVDTAVNEGWDLNVELHDLEGPSAAPVAPPVSTLAQVGSRAATARIAPPTLERATSVTKGVLSVAAPEWLREMIAGITGVMRLHHSPTTSVEKTHPDYLRGDLQLKLLLHMFADFSRNPDDPRVRVLQADIGCVVNTLLHVRRGEWRVCGPRSRHVRAPIAGHEGRLSPQRARVVDTRAAHGARWRPRG